MPENLDDGVGQGSPVPPSPAPRRSPLWDRRKSAASSVPTDVPGQTGDASSNGNVGGEMNAGDGGAVQYPAPTRLPQFPPVTPPPPVILPEAGSPSPPEPYIRRHNTPSWGRSTPAAAPPPVILPQAGSPPPPPVLLPESPGTLESPVVLPDYPPPTPAPGDPDFTRMTSGFTAPPISSIETWPPLIPEVEKSYPLSQRTGEPRRPLTLIAAIAFCWLSVACTIVAFGGWWWRAAHISTFTSSARLLAWTHPDPVSALAIVMVILVGLIGLLMVAAAGTAAYNSWVGRSWIRVGGWVCVAVTGLSFLLTWWFSIAMIPLVVGVSLLWLPSVKLFFTAMDSLAAVQPVDVPTTGIRYGPQTLVGHR